MYLMTGNFNIGALIDLVYAEITKIDNIDYLEGQDKSHFFTGLGLCCSTTCATSFFSRGEV